MAAERFRVIARAIILTPDRRVVLVSSQTGQALVLPGGAVDRGETLPDAARREAQEECGVEVTIGRAIWLREYVDRRRDQTNLEVYFLAEPASGAALPDRWQQADRDKPDLTRQAGLYSREELRSIETPVYPVELREAFWLGLANGFADMYLGRVEG
jgi:ADP-ribose pyrophosphatase YjhB (NUDIX family)